MVVGKASEFSERGRPTLKRHQERLEKIRSLASIAVERDIAGVGSAEFVGLTEAAAFLGLSEQTLKDRLQAYRMELISDLNESGKKYFAVSPFVQMSLMLAERERRQVGETLGADRVLEVARFMNRLLDAPANDRDTMIEVLRLQCEAARGERIATGLEVGIGHDEDGSGS